MKDRVVKLGLIGCGAIARQYHIPSLVNTPGCRVVAVCDLIRERADWAGSQFGLGPDRCFTDADELLSIPEIEGVVILTPNYNHCEMTVKAASYHKHVFITKPMARDTNECEKMIEACKNSGVQLFVNALLVLLAPQLVVHFDDLLKRHVCLELIFNGLESALGGFERFPAVSGRPFLLFVELCQCLGRELPPIRLFRLRILNWVKALCHC